MIALLDLLKLMDRLNASDAFITAGAPISLKVDGSIKAINNIGLSPTESKEFAYSMMDENQVSAFEETKEANFAIHPKKASRFRVNVYVQRGFVSAVLRKISSHIPTVEELNLPGIINKLAMQKRGLVLMVGSTGCGKSTTQAAMVGYRNANAHDHIITIEDPIEFLHYHKKSIVTQREVGIDTDSFDSGLQNALRQSPDVIQIGEIRDAELMRSALNFAQAGHLCLATLHANNTYKALDRIISFFEESKRPQLLMDLSMNLTALVSQRLVPRVSGAGRIAAVEVMSNTPLISDIIQRGEIMKIPDVMEKGRGYGLLTFDQSLFELYDKKLVSAEDALRHADSENNLRLKMKLDKKGEVKKPIEKANDLMAI